MNDIPLALAPDRGRIAALRTAFAERVRTRRPLVLPGVTDALGARLVERAGFEACYATGAGLANVQYGLPDVGLIGLDDVAGNVRRITNVLRLPLLADIDTGYGGPLAVMRTVRTLEGAGAAGLQIEDQADPKRCGHFDRHLLIDAAEMGAKIKAAVSARDDANMLIVARTDALGVLGADEAIRRAADYLRAGADVLFIEAPTSVKQLERIGAEFRGVPLVANMVEGGLTPQLSARELGDLGFTVILFANFLMRIMVKAGRDALEVLRETGDSRPLAGSMLTWPERQDLVDLSQFIKMDDSYQ